jgi:hypothetical protein
MGTIVFWCLSGILLSGLAGHLRGSTGMGMVFGFFLGPILGPIAVLLATLGGRETVSDPGQPQPPPS